MTRASLFRVGPIARISLGLVAMIVSLVLLADMLFGVVPGRAERQREVRQRVTENLATQITALLEAGDTATLGKTLRQVLERDTDIRTITPDDNELRARIRGTTRGVRRLGRVERRDQGRHGSSPL